MRCLSILLLSGLLASGCRVVAGYDRVSPDAGVEGSRDAGGDASDGGRLDTGDAFIDGVVPLEAGRPDFGLVAMVFDPGCTVDGWCSDNHRPTPEDLNGATCLPSGACYAVGNAGTVLVFENNHWRREQTKTAINLKAVWAGGPNNVVAVGGNQILRFDGTQWATGPIAGAELVAVWGSGTNEVYVTGPQGTWHSTGGSFSPVTAAWGDSRSIWGDGTGLVILGGANGGLVKLKALAAAATIPCGSLPIVSLWGRGATEVYALDEGGTVYLFDGGACKILGGAGPGSPYFSLFGQVTNGQVELFAGGSGMLARVISGNVKTVAYGHDLRALAGDEARGPRFAFGTAGSIHQRQGATFKHVNPPAVTVDLRGVAALGSSVRAVGTDVIASGGSSGWAVDSTSAPNIAFAGAWSDSKAAFAVGNNGALYQILPTVLRVSLTGVNSALRDGWSDGSGSFFALSGASGPALQISAGGLKSWPGDAYGAWGVSASEIYFVDRKGQKLLRYEGTFSLQTEVTTANLPWAVWGTASTNIFVGCDQGEIRHKSGAVWSQKLTGTSKANIRAIVGQGSWVYSAGQQGTIYRLDNSVEGNSWLPQLSGTRALINDLAVDENGRIWAVGERGVILRKDP